jgi:hypothetical protein
MFANKYSSDLARDIGVSGFGHITKKTILPLMNRLYWFRVHSKTLKLEKLLAQHTNRFRRFVGCLKQTLHTINNLIIKKMDCFGPEIGSYADLARQTAYLFRDLFTEYIVTAEVDIPLQCTPPVFREAKDFFNYVKQNHEHQDFNVRMSILTYVFRNRSLGRFFGVEFRRLRNYISKRNATGLGDYTQSLAWDYRSTMLCQTRSLGYLPYYLVREKATEFWNKVTRDRIEVSDRRLNQIMHLVFDELAINGVKRNLLALDKQIYEPIIRDSVRLELKYSASTTHTVSTGGKPEDARTILQGIREARAIIPIRNLDNFKITGFTPLLTSIPDDIGGIDISSILFWYSLQTMINHLTKKGLWEGNYYALPTSLKTYEDNIFETVLICINEPGKARMLVKSMSNFNWFLTPASKICQKILSELPDHKAGLVLGSHDWQHAKRISGESLEANFMYDIRSGELKPDVIMGFMDWTEATDSMAKKCGIAHLLSLWGYVGFPERYAQIIAVALEQDQPVREFLTLQGEDDDFDRIVKSGSIKEGFMMGNQMTKTILHLSHLSQRNLAEKYLNHKGIVVKRAAPGLRRRAMSRLNRSIEKSRLSTAYA